MMPAALAGRAVADDMSMRNIGVGDLLSAITSSLMHAHCAHCKHCTDCMGVLSAQASISLKLLPYRAMKDARKLCCSLCISASCRNVPGNDCTMAIEYILWLQPLPQLLG